MGLFDVFSKGGKYFGKAIEPKCEYCEHGKRSSDGNKVLCTKKGMVDASSRCPKFLYSPLKRIPVKQLERVGFLVGDYDEVEEKLKAKAAEKAAAASAPAPAPSATPAAPAAQTTPAPTPAPTQTIRPSGGTSQQVRPASPVTPAAGFNNSLAALAAAAEAAGEYNPEPPKTEEKPEDDAAEKPAEPSTPPTLSSM